MKDPDRAKETAARYLNQRVRLTYDDYCRMPAGLRYELVEGDLRMVPSPSVRHQTISKRLERLLLERVEDAGRGTILHAPCDVVLSEHNVVQPDVLFVAKDRLGIIREANIQGPPDLVIEILSQSTEDWDRTTKRRAYARYGVRELWFVDPEAKTIEVASLVQPPGGLPDLVTVASYPAGTTARGPLLPEFEVEVSRLFEERQ